MMLGYSERILKRIVCQYYVVELYGSQIMSDHSLSEQTA